MVKVIKSILINFYLRIIRNRYLKNIYNTSYTKNVLIVYTTSAFDKKVRYSHSNLWECKLAGEIFNELGYNVDVINYNSNKAHNIEKYSVIYGMGETFEKLFSQKNEKQIFINYATGCNPIWSNIETTKKVRSFYKKIKKNLIESSRIINYSQHFQILLSDHVIVLGDDFVKSTYLLFDDEKHRYSNLNAFFFDFHNITIKEKDVSVARKNFLWFGSAGALHKGLDLCLDYFKKNKDLNLHICGLNTHSEKQFTEYYHNEIFQTPNIHYHGFLNLWTNEFQDVLKQCGYVIFPSVSEGGAVALLNTIGNGGLLPIYSKTTGVPFDNYGFEFDKLEIETLENTISKALEIGDAEFCNRALNLQEYVRKEFTLDGYKINLTTIISNIINDHKA